MDGWDPAGSIFSYAIPTHNGGEKIRQKGNGKARHSITLTMIDEETGSAAFLEGLGWNFLQRKGVMGYRIGSASTKLSLTD